MASTLVSKNVRVNGVRTSIRLEPAMWRALAEICAHEQLSRNDLVSLVDDWRPQSSLTAAIRVFIMNYFRQAATPEGHRAAGHGSSSTALVQQALELTAPGNPDSAEAPIPAAASPAH